MNVIYMHTHDTGRFIELYGYPISTPNLMKFAEESVVFRNAFCAGPSCSPSRAALLTGMAPHSCGMIGLTHRGFQLHDYNTHLVRFLNKNDYETILSGFQHEAPDKEMIGYQNILHDQDVSEIEISGEGLKRWDLSNARKAAEEIKQHKDKPFFLSFGMMNTHRPFPDISGHINPNYVTPPFSVFDNDQNRKDTAALMSAVGVVDQCVGIIMEALKQSGKEDDTLLIFTTDHGIPFPRMKCHLYDAGIGVSLMMKLPDGRQAGKVIDGLVSQIDLFPTICELTELPKPKWLQGKSMLPLFEGTKEHLRHEIFSELTFHTSYEPTRCIRTERYKFIKFFDEYRMIIHIGGDGGISEKFVESHGIFEETRESEMLFDLYLDPMEQVNLVHNPKYRDVYSDLSTRLENWMEETEDPLLLGPITPPDGANITPPNELNPFLDI